MTLIDAAAGILHLANMNMAYAIGNITIERGHDPREFPLICYGGVGALFAGFILNELKVAADEMKISLINAAHNPLIFELQDLSPTLTNFRGEMLNCFVLPEDDSARRSLRLRAILKRLGNMRDQNICAVIKIGDCAA